MESLHEENTEREDPSPGPPPGPGPGPDQDRTPTVGLEMTDRYLDRGREGRHPLVVTDQIRETKPNQKRGIFVRSTAG